MADTLPSPASFHFADELRALVDRQELAELVDRLGLWLDEQRWDEAPAILTEDATAETPGGKASGRQAVVEQARRNHAGKLTQHVTTNRVIELDGDRATIGANLVVTFAPRAQVGEPFLQLGERYRLGAVRTSEGWRLSAVSTTPLWLSGDRGPGS